MRRLLPLLLSMAACAGAAPVTERVVIAGRQVDIWKPEGKTPPTGFPMVLFSHGYLGCGIQSSFLMEALARAGYFVLAPNHRDALCGGARLHSLPFPEESFFHSKEWSDTTYRDRLADLKAVLDADLTVNWFEGVPVDRKRVALVGHSLGGYTVLGMAGAWPSWKDNRVKAVLALSPYCSPYIDKGNLRHLKVPVMYQGGTMDFGITPAVSRHDGAYDSTAAPKYFVEFRGASHLAWTDLETKYQSIIVKYSLAFLDRYLKGPDHLTPLMVKPQPAMVSLVRSDLK